MDSLVTKEKQAIALIRSFEKKHGTFELCYSGGKDSDVILHLCKVAGVNCRPIYKSTTIDPPGTITHVIKNGVEINRPKITFFELVRKKGIPTRRARFCCSVLKEYPIMKAACLGIRREESSRRALRYKEPTICRVYSKSVHVEQLMPILEWTNDDIFKYIIGENIQLHPLYYTDGVLHVERRLGCIGCPLKSDCGKGDFLKYPKFFKAHMKAAAEWWITHPSAKSHVKFETIFHLVFNDLFCRSYQHYLDSVYTMFDKLNVRAYLEDYFSVDLSDVQQFLDDNL